MLRLGLSLALVLAAAALAAPPSQAFSRLNTCVPQYANDRMVLRCVGPAVAILRDGVS